MRIYKKPEMEISIFDSNDIVTASGTGEIPVVTPEPTVPRTSAAIELNKAMNNAGSKGNYVAGSLMN